VRDETRRWRVGLPWLADATGQEGDGRTQAVLDWFLARAERSPATSPWREWLLADASLGADVLARFPAGPSVRAAWTGETPIGRWACAGPVHLLAALDHLRLAAPAPLPIGEAESAALVAGLNEQLAGSGFTLHAVPRRGWLCECPEDLECEAPEPAAAVGDNLRNWLPTGRDARRVRAWLNEAQMILHEHPVNAARSARGDPPVNSVWLWGFGRAGQPSGTVGSVLVTDDDWLAGLWGLHGGRTVTVVDINSATVPSWSPAITRIAIAAAPMNRATGDHLSAALRALFDAMRAALETGAVDRVSIHAGTEVLNLDRRARWRFWRRPRPLSRTPE
jgi:hypothetical protein